MKEYYNYVTGDVPLVERVNMLEGREGERSRDERDGIGMKSQQTRDRGKGNGIRKEERGRGYV